MINHQTTGLHIVTSSKTARYLHAMTSILLPLCSGLHLVNRSRAGDWTLVLGHATEM